MAKKVIILKGEYIAKEGVASEEIKPGHLIEFIVAETDQGQLKKHATAGGDAQKMFALEQDYMGDGIEDVYADGDRLKYAVPQRGAEVNAILTTSQTIVKGDALESTGDGTVRKYTPPSQAVNEGGAATYTIAPKVNAILGYAAEAKTTTAAVARIALEVA